MAVEIALVNSEAVAIVDEVDADRVNSHSWCLTVPRRGRRDATLYVVCYERKLTHVKLHRFVLGLAKGDGTIVDHVNGIGLDNRRSNLRLASHSGNQCNRGKYGLGHPKYKGVFKHSRSPKWQVSIGFNRQKFYIGMFASEIDAARAYDIAAIDLHGEFARLNFPREEYA